MSQPISENLWWVVPGQLAGVRKPEPAELPELEAAGIGAIASVMDDPTNLDAYARAGIPHLWLPTTGGTAPRFEQVQAFEQFVAEQQAQQRAVAVHCTSGRRRTGTLLAAYLIRSGLSFETVMQRIAEANPAVEFRDAQIEFLRSLATCDDSLA
jgi:protein tyrosine phosphatase (PTP) superfamily phosphohydrolase (DUF442 family)